MRYRLYSTWGFSASEIATVVAFSGVTLWFGVLLLGGLVFLYEPLMLPAALSLPFASLPYPWGALSCSGGGICGVECAAQETVNYKRLGGAAAAATAGACANRALLTRLGLRWRGSVRVIASRASLLVPVFPGSLSPGADSWSEQPGAGRPGGI